MLLMSRSAYHHGDLAHALESAAMELLGEQPAQSISLREVARRAGVSHNAPYHHFGDRTQLLKVLAERSMTQLVGQVRAVLAASSEPAERAAALLRCYVGYALNQPHAFAAIYDPTICVPGAPTATMAPLIDELEQIVADLAVALRPGQSAAATTGLASALWASAHGVAELGRAGHLTPEGCEAAVVSLLDDVIHRP